MVTRSITVEAAATAGYFYSDTATGSYELGTLDEDPDVRPGN